MTRSIHRHAFPILLASLLAAPIHAQEVLLEASGTMQYDYFGFAISAGPDLDGDGFAEVAVGAPSQLNGINQVGAAVILSGRDFSVMRTIYGVQGSEAFGMALAWCGDVDGDGVDDLAVGAPIHIGVGKDSGIVRIHSGATGAMIREIPGADVNGRFGFALADLGDTNGDGVDDLLVGAPQDPTIGPFAGLVAICSGADGSTLQTILGAKESQLGWSVANVGDLDGDGVNDFAAGAPFADGPHAYDSAGSVFVYSGATAALLLQFDGGDEKCYWYSFSSYSGDRLGTATGAAGDFDGDGVPDVWAASFWGGACGGVGYIEVVSGATGATLYKVNARGSSQWHASEIGDVDGDGRTDFISQSLSSIYIFSSVNGRVVWETNNPQNADLGSAFAPAGDRNGDGRPDFLLGADLDGSLDVGSVEVIASNDLWLDVSPTHFPATGKSLELRANSGPPGNPAGLVLTALNGAPRFDLVAVATFDASGSALLASGTVPPGLAGNSITLRAFAIDASGRIVDSIDEVLHLR